MLETLKIFRQRGLSLVELMVTIAVLGILASVALPAYNNLIERTRIRAATEAVTDLLQFSRLESIKQNRDFQIVGTNGANWCMAITNLGAAACTCGTDCAFTTADGTVTRFINSDQFRGITLGGLPTDAATLIRFTTPSGMSVGGGCCDYVARPNWLVGRGSPHSDRRQ